MRAAALARVALAVALAAPAGARAEEPSASAKEEASARFERGVKLFQDQDFAAALAEFEAAHRLVPAYPVLFNIAVAQKKLFRYGDAVRTFDRYLKEGGAQIGDERREQVERELQEIRALVAEVTVNVRGLPARVEVDGRAAGDSPLERPLLLPPGHHVVRAVRAGDQPAERALEVVSGDRATIELDPRPIPRAPTEARLTIAVNPAGATLSLDGKPIGPNPWSGLLGAGGHELVARAAGFEKVRREVVVTAGQDRAITVELPPITPVIRRWYTWTIPILLVAAIVAAGVGGYYATHSYVAIPYR